MREIVWPPKNGNFFLLGGFFNHIHDENTAARTYVIPWENSLFVIPKRDKTKAGCVACVVRRLIATTYHRQGQIYGVDSIWCRVKESDKNLRFEFVQDEEISSTKCLIFEQHTKSLKEVHVLPVPACLCSYSSFPNLSEKFVETWMQKWPNVMLNKIHNHFSNGLLHLYSAKLPNVAPIFVSSKASNACIPSSATAASLRDEGNLSKRLLGESIERYALHYVPHERLLIYDEKSKEFLQNNFYPLKPPLWTKVVNASGKVIYCSADEVFSGLHKLYSAQFKPLSSSGVAAHTDIELARTHALLELLERDALLVAWRLADYTNLLRSLPSKLKETREKKWIEKLLHHQGHELVVCAVENQFNLPLVLTISFPISGLYCVPNFGSGIGFTWEIAYKKALNELLQGIAIPESKVLEALPTRFNERPCYWASPKLLPILRKRLTPLERDIDICNESFSLHDLIKKFESISLPLYFADLTTPDIALSNWKVVRALCPKFESFVGNANYENPNIDRINFFLNTKNKTAIKNINRDPFPFA